MGIKHCGFWFVFIICVFLVIGMLGTFGYVTWSEKINPCICSQLLSSGTISPNIFIVRYFMDCEGSRKLSKAPCCGRREVTEAEYNRIIYDLIPNGVQ